MLYAPCADSLKFNMVEQTGQPRDTGKRRMRTLQIIPLPYPSIVVGFRAATPHQGYQKTRGQCDAIGQAQLEEVAWDARIKRFAALPPAIRMSRSDRFRHPNTTYEATNRPQPLHPGGPSGCILRKVQDEASGPRSFPEAVSTESHAAICWGQRPS